MIFHTVSITKVWILCKIFFFDFLSIFFSFINFPNFFFSFLFCCYQAKHKRSPGSPTYSECVSQLTFQSTNGRLYVNGIPFDLKGLNWFGMEDTDMVPEGCSGYYSNIPTCYAFYFNFIQSNGFNGIVTKQMISKY